MGELLIIGAGPAGLALSHHYPGPSRILERSGEVGGLCRSIEFGGGVFDIGGHSFHTPYADVADLVGGLMRGRWSVQQRDARVFVGGQLIDYPFQRHFDQLRDPRIVAECRAHRPSDGSGATAETFEDWIVQRFGAGVARHFMLPYNRKLWARDLRRMSCEWVGERVADGDSGEATPPLPRRQPLQSTSEVGYPADGGFVEIYRAMARGCGPIEFGRELARVDPVTRTARSNDGGVWRWDRLVSTMPLPRLLRAIEGCPPDLIADADQLEFVSLKMLLILVGRPLADQPQRVYSADPAVPPHKTAFNHTSSASLRARPVHAVMCEIAHSPEKPLAPDDALTRTTVDWLVDAGLIGARADVAETRVVDVEYGYPVYTPSRPAILERIRAYLAPLGVFTLGRFGGWDYVNSDACIRQGAQLAAQLALTEARGG
jgi:UDP-galactopyranose mutase